MLLFLKIFFTEFIAEMGDKTQLMLIALTPKYKLKDIIFGTAAAILVLNGLAVLAGGLGQRIYSGLAYQDCMQHLHFFTLLHQRSPVMMTMKRKRAVNQRLSSLHSQFSAHFSVAEFGDKTQLTAITFGANEGMESALIVWIGCSLGLFAADILGMFVGYLLKSKTPEGLLNTLAFVIFSVFGVYTFYQGLKLISTGVCPIPVWPVLIVVTVAFAVLCVCLFVRREKKVK